METTKHQGLTCWQLGRVEKLLKRLYPSFFGGKEFFLISTKVSKTWFAKHCGERLLKIRVKYSNHLSCPSCGTYCDNLGVDRDTIYMCSNERCDHCYVKGSDPRL